MSKLTSTQQSNSDIDSRSVPTNEKLRKRTYGTFEQTSQGENTHDYFPETSKIIFDELFLGSNELQSLDERMAKLRCHSSSMESAKS